METLPKITPINDRVLAKKLPADTTTAGGVILPDTAKEERPQLAKVLAVGPGRLDDNGKLIPVGVKEGQIVIFGKYTYTDIHIRGEEFMMLRADEIWGTVEDMKFEEEACQ